MSVVINTGAMKVRESTSDPWASVTVVTDAEVEAVVQDFEPTGNENVWFDTSDQTEVSVPTMAEFNALQNTLIKVVEKSTTGLTDAISPGSGKEYTFSAAETGYTPIGIVGAYKYGGNNGRAVLSSVYINSNNEVTVTLRVPAGEAGNANITGVYARVLYVKS